MTNPINPGITTTEFNLTMVKVVIGVLVMAGVIAPAHQDDVTQAITTIVGGLIALIPAVTYILSRTWLKAKAAQPTPTTSVQVNPTTVVTP